MTSRLLRFARAARQPLAANPQHTFAARHALVHYHSGAVYSFIPKNGCSTLRYSLALAHGCIAGPEDINWIHNNNGTFKAELRDLVTAPYSFVVLRCPYARLASAFLDKIVGQTVVMWQLHDQVDRAFAPDQLSFRQFVQMLSPRVVRYSNLHWRPQEDFLVYEDYDDWFRLEDFSTAGARIEERCGLTLHDARPLTKHGLDQFDRIDDGFFGDMPVQEIRKMKRNGKAPSYRALYDDGLKTAVSRMYSADIALVREKTGSVGLLFESESEQDLNRRVQ
jgi:hypothetical protein